MSLCRWFYLPIVVALAGCASRAPAPMGAPSAPVVVEGGAAAAPAAVLAAPATGREGFYIVKKGDTLRKIAQDHGRDHRQVAAWNNLTDPNKLEVGQELRIAPPDGEAEVRPIVTVAPVVVAPEPAASTVSGGETLKRWPKGGKIAYSETALVQAKALDGAAAPARAPAATPPQPATAGIATAAVATTPAAPPVPATPPAEAVDWTWPVGGKVISEFVEGGGGKESNKGIDLAGRMGEPVQAAAAGKVAVRDEESLEQFPGQVSRIVDELLHVNLQDYSTAPGSSYNGASCAVSVNHAPDLNRHLLMLSKSSNWNEYLWRLRAILVINPMYYSVLF